MKWKDGTECKIQVVLLFMRSMLPVGEGVVLMGWRIVGAVFCGSFAFLLVARFALVCAHNAQGRVEREFGEETARVWNCVQNKKNRRFGGFLFKKIRGAGCRT